jgi:predicted enzyme related to lactoylglutathione lyase
MTSRIAAISMVALDPQRVAEFWRSVLGWELLQSDATGADIGPADGSGPRIEIGRVSDSKTVKNRIHLDLRADGSSQDDELQRLLHLGATRIDVGQPSDATWVVLADPEGNEFCLLLRTVQEAVDGG